MYFKKFKFLQSCFVSGESNFGTYMHISRRCVNLLNVKKRYGCEIRKHKNINMCENTMSEALYLFTFCFYVNLIQNTTFHEYVLLFLRGGLLIDGAESGRCRAGVCDQQFAAERRRAGFGQIPRLPQVRLLELHSVIYCRYTCLFHT